MSAANLNYTEIVPRQCYGVFYRGEKRPVTEWCRILGLKPGTIQRRIRMGWTVRQAFETPIGER